MGLPSTTSVWRKLIPWLCFLSITAYYSALRALDRRSYGNHQHQEQNNRDLQAIHLDGISVNLDSVYVQLEQRQVMLPNATLEQSVAGFILTLEMTNVRCSHITLGGIRVAWHQDSPTALRASIDVDGVDCTCNLDFYFNWFLVSNRGSAQLRAGNSSLHTDLLFESPTNMDLQPPTALAVASCDPNIVITDLSFESGGTGALLSAVLNAIEEGLRGTVAGAVDDTICKTMAQTQANATSLLQNIDDLLARKTPQPPTNGNLSSTLTAESKLQIPAGVEFANFEQPNSTLALLLTFALRAGSAYLGTAIESPFGGTENGSSSPDLIINQLVRTLLLADNNRSSFDVNLSRFELDMNNLTSQIEGLQSLPISPSQLGIRMVRLHNASVIGLDHIVSLDAFDPSGCYTMETGFTARDVTIEVRGELDFDYKSTGSNNDTTNDQASIRVQDFNISVTLTKLNVSAAILMAVDLKSLGSIRLGRLLANTDIACVLSSLYEMQITSVTVNDLAFQQVSVGGLDESPVLRSVLTAAVSLAFNAYVGSLSGAIPLLLGSNLSSYVRSFWRTLSSSDNSTCAQPLTGSETATVDFRDLLLSPDIARLYGATGSQPYGNLSHVIKSIMDSLAKADGSNGTPKFNKLLIDPLTLANSGMMGRLQSERIVEFRSNDTSPNLISVVTLTFRELQVENLDTFSAPLVLVDPVPAEPSVLSNSVRLGSNTRPVRLSLRLVINIESNEATSWDELVVTLDLGTIDLLATLFVSIISKDFLNIPLESLFDLNCILSSIQPPALNDTTAFLLQEFKATTSTLWVSLNCTNCTSLLVQQVARLLPSPSEKNLGSSHSSAFSFSGEDYLMIQRLINDFIYDGREMCATSAVYDPTFRPAVPSFEIPGLSYQTNSKNGRNNSLEFMLVMISFSGVVMVSVLVASYGFQWIVSKRHLAWLEGLSAEEIIAIYEQQKREDEIEALLNSSTQSIFESQRVPHLARYLIPFLLLATLALFFSGLLSPMAEGRAYMTFLDNEMVVLTVKYSIKDLVALCWKAGARYVAVMVAITSVFWPLLKQSISLALWFLPPSVLSVSTRGKTFMWLDVLGKWTMIVLFMSIFNIAASWITLENPTQLHFLPYHIQLAYVPSYGLYTTITAQILGQIVSRTMIYFHRHLVNFANAPDESSDSLVDVDSSSVDGNATATENRSGSTSRSEGDAATRASGDLYALCQASFTGPLRSASDSFRVRPSANLGFAVLSIVALGLAVVGCILPSYKYMIGGIVGAAAQLAHNSTDTADDGMSVFSLTRQLLTLSKFLDVRKQYLGLGFLAVFLVVTVFVLPLILIVSLLVQWFVPMTQAAMYRRQAATEILLSWEYVEVYLVAIVVCAWQIDGLSEIVVGQYCGTFTSLFTALIISVEDDQCLRVEGAADYACFVLMLAVVLLYFQFIVVSKACKQRFRNQDRSHKIVSSFFGYTEADTTLMSRQIRPLPVLFTDRFRWLLQRNDVA